MHKILTLIKVRCTHVLLESERLATISSDLAQYDVRFSLLAPFCVPPCQVYQMLMLPVREIPN